MRSHASVNMIDFVLNISISYLRHRTRSMKKSVLIVIFIFLWNIQFIERNLVCKENKSIKTIRVPYPNVYFSKEAKISKSYYCTGLVSSTIEALKKDIVSEKSGVVGTVSIPSDEVSIEIEDKKLFVLSKASFKQGVTRGTPFDIISDDGNKLLATFNTDGVFSGQVVNIFALNRENGIAIWTRTRLDGFITGNPDVYSICFKCEPR